MLDLNNSDLLAVTVVLKDGTRQRRFLVVDLMQIILIEPDAHRLGWGVAKFSGFLQVENRPLPLFEFFFLLFVHMLKCKLDSTNGGTFSNSAEQLILIFFSFRGP